MDSTMEFERFSMRPRKLLGLCLTTLGPATVAVPVGSAVFHVVLPVNSILVAAVAVLFLLVGLIVLVTELFEIWLNRSQAALVDELQAG
jgi:type IV secretory pathway VirB3-like protein